MKMSKFKKLNAQERMVVQEIIQNQPEILLKKVNKGWSDTPLFRAAAEERQTSLF